MKIPVVFVAFPTRGNSPTTNKCIWFSVFSLFEGIGVTKVLQNLADIDNFAKSKPLQGANCQDSIGFNAISGMR